MIVLTAISPYISYDMIGSRSFWFAALVADVTRAFYFLISSHFASLFFFSRPVDQSERLSTHLCFVLYIFTYKYILRSINLAITDYGCRASGFRLNQDFEMKRFPSLDRGIGQFTTCRDFCEKMKMRALRVTADTSPHRVRRAAESPGAHAPSPWRVAF